MDSRSPRRAPPWPGISRVCSSAPSRAAAAPAPGRPPGKARLASASPPGSGVFPSALPPGALGLTPAGGGAPCGAARPGRRHERRAGRAWPGGPARRPRGPCASARRRQATQDGPPWPSRGASQTGRATSRPCRPRRWGPAGRRPRRLRARRGAGRGAAGRAGPGSHAATQGSALQAQRWGRGAPESVSVSPGGRPAAWFSASTRMSRIPCAGTPAARAGLALREPGRSAGWPRGGAHRSAGRARLRGDGRAHFVVVLPHAAAPAHEHARQPVEGAHPQQQRLRARPPVRCAARSRGRACVAAGLPASGPHAAGLHALSQLPAARAHHVRQQRQRSVGREPHAQQRLAHHQRAELVVKHLRKCTSLTAMPAGGGACAARAEAGEARAGGRTVALMSGDSPALEGSARAAMKLLRRACRARQRCRRRPRPQRALGVGDARE